MLIYGKNKQGRILAVAGGTTSLAEAVFYWCPSLSQLVSWLYYQHPIFEDSVMSIAGSAG